MILNCHAALLLATLLPAAQSYHLQYQRLNIQHQHKNKNVVAKNNHNSNQLQMRLNPTSFKNTNYIITEFPRPSLRRVPNKPITTFDTDETFQSKTQQMLSIMYEAKGVGLAAPQIGLNEDLFVYNPSDSKSMERIVCNPKITKYSKDIIVDEEGCLSLRSDECAGQVARAAWIEVSYQNELGQSVRRRLKDFEARVFQHEYDHLKGILCYDRFPPEDREAVQKSIDMFLGLYTEDDALVDADENEVKDMQPRPLSARYMPPLDIDESVEDEEDDEDVAFKKKQKTKANSSAGGFGLGGGMGNKKKEKKKKKKAPKARNAAFSDNPKFKSSGKTPYANRK